MTRVRMYVWILFLCLVAVGNWTLADNGHATFTLETNQDILPLVMAGSHNAFDSIRNGRGQVVAMRTSFFPDGKVRQRTESKCETLFSGNKLRGVQETTYVENNPTPGQDSTGLYPIGHVERLQVFYDDTRVVAFFPDKGMARVSSAANKASVLVARFFHGSMKDGHGVIDLSSEYWAGSSTDEYSIEGFKIVGREMVDGDECIVVETTKTRRSDGASNTHQLWVNPVRGYVIPRVRAWRTGGSLKQKVLTYEDHTEFSQRGEAWVPAHFTVDHYAEEGYKMIRLDITFGPNFEVNASVTDDELQLPLPSGTKVHDDILNADYTVP